MKTQASSARDAAHPAPHAVLLAGLRPGHADARVGPSIVERRDQDFVAGLLADLADETRRASLRASAPARQHGTPRLFQPVQRVFNLVVVEAFCDLPGQPRLDPSKIEAAGVVVRKLDGSSRLAWLRNGTRAFGWEAVDEDVDPVADKRPRTVVVGSPALDDATPTQRRVRTAGSLRLAGSDEAVSEDVTPLFVAPPQVCAAAGKTLLFGHLPVTSGAATESGPQPPDYGADPEERTQLRAHLVPHLRADAARPLPLAGRDFATEDVRAAAQGAPGALARAEVDRLDEMNLLLSQLHHEFDAFGDAATGRRLMALLARIDVETDAAEVVAGVTRVRTTRRPASEFLGEAKAVLLDARPGARLAMPHRWGGVPAALADEIFAAALEALRVQYARLKPSAGRYEATRAGDEPRYVARAFVRLKPDAPGCPPRLVWSDYTEPYTIAAWWESAGGPVPVIAMPDLFDRDVLERMKPNVAFALPPKLANLLRGDPRKLRDGEGSEAGLALGWICAFSLPIITLCAFIVLNIFLQLFAVIFFWLPFLKICIPFPKSK